MSRSIGTVNNGYSENEKRRNGMYISKWYQIKFEINQEIEQETGEVHFYYDTILVSGEMGEILKAIADGELFHIKPEAVREIKQVYKNAIIFRD